MYLLSESLDNDIGMPKAYATFEDAAAEMARDFAEVIGLSVDAVENYHEHDGSLNSFYAWISNDHVSVTWEICHIDPITLRVQRPVMPEHNITETEDWIPF